MLRTSFLLLYAIREPTEVIRLCPLTTRLDPHTTLSRKVQAYMTRRHTWTLGWVRTILHHPTPRSSHSMMRMDPSFLDVRLMNPAGWVGLRQIQDLRALSDVVVPDNTIDMHLSIYVSDLLIK